MEISEFAKYMGALKNAKTVDEIQALSPTNFQTSNGLKEWETARTGALDAVTQQGAKPYYPAMVDYVRATGTTDPRFTDPESRAVLAAGTPATDKTDPWYDPKDVRLPEQLATGNIGPFASTPSDPRAASALAGLTDKAQSEADRRDYIAGTNNVNVLARVTGDDATKQHMAVIRNVAADYQAGQLPPGLPPLDERKYADTKANEANKSNFLSAITGIGGAYQPAQPLRFNESPIPGAPMIPVIPTGPNVNPVNGLDYSDANGNPTKPRIMPFDEAKNLVTQAASAYGQDPKDVLGELNKQYTETHTDASGLPSALNWMGKGEDKSQTEEQLTMRALNGDTKAQGVLDAMQARRVKIAAESRPPKTAGSGRLVQAFDKETRDLVYVDSADIKGNPNRYAPAGAQAKANQQATLIEDIRGTLNNTMASLDKVNFDNSQQAQIALMLKHRDPASALSSFLGSKVGQTLNPAQVDYITDLAVLKENILAMRTLLGGGQGSQDQRAAIEATIPGAVSPNKAFAKVQLQKALRTLDRLQRGTANASLKPEGGGGSGAVTRDEATRYLQRAGGNKDKARELARAEGRSF